MTALRRAALAAVVLAVAAVPLWSGAFAVTLLSYVGIYALPTLGLVLLTGVGGLTSFGQAAFVGIAAYTTAWATTAGGLSPWVGLALALVATGLAAAAIGAVTLRLGGHFLPLSTIAWGISIYYLFGNLDVLGRFGGLSGIPAISLFGLSLLDGRRMYWLIWAMVGLSVRLVVNLLDSRQGRAIRSLRGGSVLLASVGIDAVRVRLTAFVLAALLAGLSGWLYAHLSRFVSPAPFDVQPGIEYLLMAMVGGAGHVAGALVGAAVITLAKDGLQDLLPHLTANPAPFESVVFAGLLILLMQHARGGIVGLLLRRLPRPQPAPVSAAAPLPRRDLPARGTPILAVDAAEKRFGGLVAVNQVSFDVRAGEIVGLIGPNGAGKSTMFNLLTGALRVTGGRVRILGREAHRLPQRRIAALGVARTFQHVKLRPGMTLLENVALGTYLRTSAGVLRAALRLDRAEERRALAEAQRQLDRVGLGGRAHEPAGTLPLGSQRILEVARALASDPVMVLLDEPAAGLRQLEKQALAQLLARLRDEGVTILIVEHDMSFVMGLVDRLVVMEFGAKLVEGEPAAVRADTRVQDAYLGGVA